MVVCRAGAYVGMFRQAVLDFLAFAPGYSEPAEKLADAVKRAILYRHAAKTCPAVSSAATPTNGVSSWAGRGWRPWGRRTAGHGSRGEEGLREAMRGRRPFLDEPPRTRGGLPRSLIWFIRLKNAPGFARGFSRHKSGVQWYLRIVCRRGYTGTPGETESGSAGTQPDKGYPGSGAPMARQAPDGFCQPGPFSWIPLDTGLMPKKSCGAAAFRRNNLRLRTLQSDEPLISSRLTKLPARKGGIVPRSPRPGRPGCPGARFRQGGHGNPRRRSLTFTACRPMIPEGQAPYRDELSCRRGSRSKSRGRPSGARSRTAPVVTSPCASRPRTGG